MNLLEAIQGAGDNWFRPAFSKGMAYEFELDHLVYTDGINFYHGGVQFLHSTLTGEWEIVTPEQVLAERKL